jgi:hypothetical protein
MVTLVNGSFESAYPGIRVAGVAPAADVPDVRGGVTLLAVVAPALVRYAFSCARLTGSPLKTTAAQIFSPRYGSGSETAAAEKIAGSLTICSSRSAAAMASPAGPRQVRLPNANFSGLTQG